uniref:Uncharacterized protein n=1 Tax=Oryza sativa subsp. japonica TaxID=39947 RepID=Q94GN5_ORYSJ|nr:hypothetical protein [Oryza sativa Japonica Group]
MAPERPRREALFRHAPTHARCSTSCAVKRLGKGTFQCRISSFATPFSTFPLFPALGVAYHWHPDVDAVNNNIVLWSLLELGTTSNNLRQMPLAPDLPSRPALTDYPKPNCPNAFPFSSNMSLVISIQRTTFTTRKSIFADRQK